MAVNKKQEKIIVIGASTGGPKALLKLFPSFPANFPFCILIAQHMPPKFTTIQANLMDRVCKIIIREAVNKDKLKPGWAFFSPGGFNLTINKDEEVPCLKVTKAPHDISCKPSIDVLFESAVNTFENNVIGLILTGLSTGNDGLKGCKHIKEAGGIVIAESKESCLMYGMPRNVIEAGYADYILPLWKIAEKIMDLI